MQRRAWSAGLLSLAIGCSAGAHPAASTPATREDPAPAECEATGERIVFERTGCLGNCPVYSIALNSSGRVDWNGVDHVPTLGEEHACIAPQTVESFRASVETWRTSHGWSGAFELDCEQTTRQADSTTVEFASSDAPGSRWSIEDGVVTHTLERDEGCPAPAPTGLEALELELHQVAEASRWLEPSARP